MSNVPPPPPPGSPPPPPPPGPGVPPPPYGSPPGYGAAPQYGQPGYGVPPGYGQPPVYYQPHRQGELAGFGVRLGGYLLDGLLYGLLMIPFMIAFGVMLAVGLRDCLTDERTGEIYCNGREDVGSIVLGVLILIVGLIVVAVIYLRALATSGQTWGRRIVKIKVIAEDTGAPPGWGKAIGRTLFEMFISGYILYLGFLWMLWDDKNQTWHDKVASTLVVRTG